MPDFWMLGSTGALLTMLGTRSPKRSHRSWTGWAAASERLYERRGMDAKRAASRRVLDDVMRQRLRSALTQRQPSCQAYSASS